jgi:hypothetical protein
MLIVWLNLVFSVEISLLATVCLNFSAIKIAVSFVDLGKIRQNSSPPIRPKTSSFLIILLTVFAKLVMRFKLYTIQS